MANISNPPKGLLSLLGLRDMGDVPRLLTENVVATVDITQFLLLDREVVQGSVTMSALNRFGLVTVPPGELWYIHQWGAATNELAAGEKVTISLGILRDDKYVPCSLQAAATAGQRAQTVVIEDLWVGAADILAGSCDEITSLAGIGLTSRAIISRFRV